MKKNQKTMLIFTIVGTMVILGMAFVDRWLYPGSLPPGMSTETAVPVEAAVEVEAEEAVTVEEEQEEAQDNQNEPMDKSDVATFHFVIQSSQSEVRFTLDEVLAGIPTTVIGISNQVTGDFSLDLNDPQNVLFGEILIDASSFVTDQSFRNRALRDRILESAAYPVIRFVPKEASPLPETVTFGEAISLEIIGDLTIKDVTKEVIFTATLTPTSETEIQGHAEVMVAYADYGITIPSVPKVANVDEEVLLEIDFVALAE